MAVKVPIVVVEADVVQASIITVVEDERQLKLLFVSRIYTRSVEGSHTDDSKTNQAKEILINCLVS